MKFNENYNLTDHKFQEQWMDAERLEEVETNLTLFPVALSRLVPSTSCLSSHA